MYVDFDAKSEEAAQKTYLKPTASARPDKTHHQYFNPLKERQIPSDRQAAEFMFRVFLLYKPLVEQLQPVHRISEHGGKIAATKFGFHSEDVRQLRMWPFFATNACMHEKLCVDFFCCCSASSLICESYASARRGLKK